MTINPSPNKIDDDNDDDDDDDDVDDDDDDHDDDDDVDDVDDDDDDDTKIIVKFRRVENKLLSTNYGYRLSTF